jgi:hypothetical protein
VGGVGFVHTTTVRLPSRTKRLFSIAGFGLMPDLFGFETWDLYRFFTNTPMETSDPASIREMSEAANNFGSPAE